MQLGRVRRARGFSLVELAVVMAILALLIGGAMLTLSAQVEIRNRSETTRRLEAAVEALIGFAIVNRRLPCPAAPGSTGTESGSSGSCNNQFDGYLPAKDLGFEPVDSDGYGIDVWGNRIRYAVASGITGCTGTSSTPHFTNEANLKANGVSCRPNNLVICKSASGSSEGSSPSCGGATNQVTGTEVVAFLVFSTGKNGANTVEYGADESANTTNTSTGSIYVHRTPTDVSASAGTYDDLLVWVPAGVLYNRLISAGVLP